MKNTNNNKERKLTPPEEPFDWLDEELTEEEAVIGSTVKLATDMIMDFGRSIPLPRQFITAAFLECFIDSILAEQDLTGVEAEKAHLLLGIHCFEDVHRAIEEARGGRDD